MHGPMNVRFVGNLLG